MRVGHSDTCPLPRFQWTRQALWNSPPLPRDAGVQTQTVANEVPQPHQTLPGNRSEHASCLLGHHVYLFGGKHRYIPLKDMWRLDLENGQWEPITFKDIKMPHLQGHSMVAYRSQVFIFGGLFGEYSDDIPLWIYSPDLNHLRKYNREPLQPCPIGRREHSAVVYKNFMYICGGLMTSSGSSDELWAFDLEEEEWLCLPPHKGGKRHGHVSVVHRHSMWVHGGVSRLESLSDLWVYHFELQTWTKIKASGKSPSLFNHTAHVVDNAIVLVGGSYKSTPSSNVWIYGIDNNTWRKVDTGESHLFSGLFLHTSILVNPKNVVDKASGKSSQSTPHLKSHLAETAACPGRPWTSPRSGDDSSQPPFKLVSSDVNVLTIHTEDNFIPLTDENNNSEENLFSPVENIEMKELNCCVGKDLSEYCFKDFHIQSSNDKKLKIRPASLEHCEDELPLLEKFCSMGSSVEGGESNTVLTLSDEHVFESSSSLVGPRTCSRSDKNVEGLFDEPHAQSQNLKCPPSNCSNVFATENDQINTCDVSCLPKSNKSFSVHVDNKLSSNIPVSDDLSRPFTKYLASGGTNLPEHYNNMQEPIPPSESTKAYADSEKNIDNVFSELDYCKLENFQSLNDLILEDIDSCNDESGALTDLTIAPPSSTFIKSSSYKDISLWGSSFDLEENLCLPHPFYIDSPRKIRSSSCSSLTVVLNRIESAIHSYQPSTTQTKSGNITQCTAMEKSGQFVKHQSRLSHRSGFWLERQRSSSHSQSQKMTTTLNKSVATQTGGSHSSLISISKLHKAMQAGECEGQINCAKRDVSAFPSTSNEPIVSALNNMQTAVFADCKYLLLVFGGHMGSPAFTNALDIWKCKIW